MLATRQAVALRPCAARAPFAPIAPRPVVTVHAAALDEELETVAAKPVVLVRFCGVVQQAVFSLRRTGPPVHRLLPQR